MNPRDINYFYRMERMVLEHQLEAALQRASALRARAARQKDFSGAKQAQQLQRVLLQSQRQLSKLSQ